MGKYLHYFQNENDYTAIRANDYKEPWVSFTKTRNSSTPTSVITSGSLNYMEWLQEHGEQEMPTDADFTGHTYDGEYFNCGYADNLWMYSGNNKSYACMAENPNPDSEVLFEKVLVDMQTYDMLLITEANYEQQQINRVNYNKSEKEKLLEIPLTFEVLSNGNITWNLYSDDETAETGFTIEYKKNDGEWTTIAASTGGTEIPVNNGDIVQFRGDNPAYYSIDYETGAESHAFFNSTCQFKAKSNIMSMINSTVFSTATTLQSTDTFSGLFAGCTGLIDAGDLLLPATTLTYLASYCYRNMFAGCSSLTTAPELPATTLANACYMSMFYGCTSLTIAPELPATTLAPYCYANMFEGCTILTTAPELPATTLTEQCYSQMFRDCTSLTTVPSTLPATTLAKSCYNYMFQNCTSLTTAPVLPATTLTQGCYNYMFFGCTSLTTAPVLPATTLTQNCYSEMFYNCSSLTTAPELPATTLANSCYAYMFAYCNKLKYIKCLATDISASNCTQIWVKGVQQTNSGTFVKNPSMSSWTTGDYGIPTNWTVQNA